MHCNVISNLDSGETLNLAVFCFVISHKLCGDDGPSVIYAVDNIQCYLLRR